VEFLPEEESGKPWDKSFDIHVAINRTTGQEECQVETESSFSQLEVSCAERGDEGPAEATVSASLDWALQDDFFLGCGTPGKAADPTGGMPDASHRFVADLAGSEPRQIGVEVTFAKPPVDSDGFILALTTSPCGASGSVIDCDWGDGTSLKISNVTLFPGETVYAVVDGLGADALTLVEPQPYLLRWTSSAPCPP